MVKSVVVVDGVADIGVFLTVAGCPMRETITKRVTEAVSRVPGVTSVRVELDVMSDEQRADMRKNLRGGTEEPVIPFAQPGSLTRVYCVASGKGGVGKSSVTVNLAVALAARGLTVGVLDADIWGFSVPRMLGIEGRLGGTDGKIEPTDVRWGDLDYLLIDMPPGTGDVQMALARMLPQAEMLVVTTPARAAQKVAT